MSDYLQKIVYLTQSDYDILAQGTEENPASVTKNGITLTNLDENCLYITDGGVVNSDISGIIGVPHGGTGKDTLLSGQVLVGNGENPITTIVKTSANTANTLVERDANGDFSARNITMTQGNIGSMTLSGTKITALTAINTTGDYGILAYKPPNWTGVSSSQWGVGTVDIQGVIRSNNSDLLHSRAGSNSVILDAGNYSNYALPLSGGTMTGAIHLVGDQSSAYNDKGLIFTNGSRIGENESGGLGIYAAAGFYLRPNSASSSSGDGIEITGDGLSPSNNNSENLGSTSSYWKNIYGTTINSTTLNGSVLKLNQGGGADPSLTSNARIEFSYTSGQPVNIAYTPNDSYRAPAGLKIMGGASASPAWLEVEGNVYAAAFKGNADTATTAGTASTLSCPAITTETAIEYGTRSYQGSGSGWTGSVVSMQYAGILQVCGDYSRGWQIWAQRGDSATAQSLHWRNPNSAANAWNEERVIIDSGNYTSYTAAKATADASGNTITTTYAPLASPTFTGTPKAPTAANGTSTTQIATTEFVNNTLAYANAMTFKGTLGTGGTITSLPASHNAGDTYRVITAGTWAGKYCEVGTLVICIKDGTAAADADWTSVETNEDGAVIGPASSTDNAIVRFDGTTGRVVQNSKAIIDDDGHLLITHTSGKSNEIEVKYSTTIDYWWGVGTANANHGLYDDITDKWILSAGADNKWNFDGNSTTATTATNLSAAPTIASGGTATINLSANTAYTLTVGGKSVIFKTPADSNTDTKVNYTLAATTKAYLMASSDAPTSTATAREAKGDSNVYLTATAGELSAVRHSYNVSGTEKAYSYYNTTLNSIDFVFV